MKYRPCRHETIVFEGGPLDGSTGTIGRLASQQGFAVHSFTGPDDEEWMAGYFATGEVTNGLRIFVVGGGDQ